MEKSLGLEEKRLQEERERVKARKMGTREHRELPQDSYHPIEELIKKAFSCEKTDPEKALDCYDQALEMDPKYLRALAYKGLLCEKLGKPREAKECFRKISLLELLGLNVALPFGGWIIGALIMAVAYMVQEVSWLSPIVGILGLLISLLSFYALKKHRIWAMKVLFKRI